MWVLIAYVFGIFSGLRAKTPQQKSIDSITPQHKAYDKRTNDKPISSFPAQLPPSKANPSNPCQSCHHKTPGWKIALEIGTFLAALGAFIATAIYAYITHRIYTEAQKQTKLMRQQLVGNQAAFVNVLAKFGVAGGNPPPSVFVEIDIGNQGIALAHNVELTGNISKQRLVDASMVAKPIPIEIKYPIMPRDKYYEWKYPFAISPSEWDGITKNKLIYRIDGTLTYENGFEQNVSETICFVIVSGNDFRPCDVAAALRGKY
jgi:hypothetical protein